MCSMDNADTFEEAFRLRKEIVDCKQEKFCDNKYWVPAIIAANKSDLPPHKIEVDVDEGRSRVENILDCGFMVCSAKTGENIEEIFGELFHLAKFPKQMSPKSHRRLTMEKSVDVGLSVVEPVSRSPSYRKSWKKTSLGALKRRDKEPETMSYQDVEARRPSLRTDLLGLRARASYAGDGNSDNDFIRKNSWHKRCSIQ